MKELPEKSTGVTSEQPLENIVDKQIDKSAMVDSTLKIVPPKPKMVKKIVKSRGEIYVVVDPEKKKHQVVGVLKIF